MTSPRLMTIFAHQDDETFSAGGTLARYADLGKAYAVTITADHKREDEFKAACEILGAQPIILENTDINPSLEIVLRNEIIALIRQFKPNHIITHLDYDYHYDHRLVRSIVEEAVEWVSHTTSELEAVQVSSLWGAETTVLIPFPEIYIDITKYNTQRLKAIECYESQSHKGGKGFYGKFHNKRTELRGIQAQVEHAEAFVHIPIALAGAFKPTKVYDRFPY